MTTLTTRTGARVAQMLCDTDIRGPLHAWLHQEHAGDPDTSIIHEFMFPRPSARIDLAVVNGRMVGFEIKSDVDSLSRLARQAVAYEAIFDRVCLVTTARHLKGVLERIPAWWGIWIPVEKQERLTFKRVRKMRANPKTNNEALLYTLTKPELLTILRAQPKPAKGIASKPKDGLVQLILGLMSSRKLRHHVRVALRARQS